MTEKSVTEEVVTAQGRMRGTWEEGVRVFRGVPFAAAPVGPLRFRPPQPAPAWQGVRSAVAHGPASYQFNGVNEEAVGQLIAELDPGAPGIMAWPSYTNATYRHDHADEDCLYLDIWVPELPKAPRICPSTSTTTVERTRSAPVRSPWNGARSSRAASRSSWSAPTTASARWVGCTSG